MDTHKFSTIEQYNDALATVYDKATQGEFKWAAPAEANKLILPYVIPGLGVLDIGIGTGQSAAELFNAGCKICGIDISQRMLEITRKKFPNFELHKANIQEGLPDFAGRSFDIVTAIGILEFVKDIDQVIHRLAELLKSSGFICFTFEEYLPEHKIQQRRISETGRGAIDPVPELLTFLTYRHTPMEIKDMLRRHGLQLLKAERFEAYLKSKELIPIYYTVLLASKV